MNSIRLLDLRVDCVTTDEILEHITDVIESGRQELVLNVNIHAFNLAHTDPEFRRILREAPIVFCDGHGVKLGARLVGRSIPEVITYDDFIWPLAALCERRGYRLFLLGGYPGDAEKAREILETAHPDLELAGAHHGFFEKEGPENARMVDLVNRAGTDVLLCSFGMPLQEKWLAANSADLSTAVMLAGGGCIDLLSGRAPRPPRWMADLGLRWLFRLTYEPRKVFRRYLFGNPLFMARVLRQRVRRNGTPDSIDH